MAMQCSDCGKLLGLGLSRKLLYRGTRDRYYGGQCRRETVRFRALATRTTITFTRSDAFTYFYCYNKRSSFQDCPSGPISVVALDFEFHGGYSKFDGYLGIGRLGSYCQKQSNYYRRMAIIASCCYGCGRKYFRVVARRKKEQ